MEIGHYNKADETILFDLLIDGGDEMFNKTLRI